MAFLFDPRFQALDANGLPLAGAELAFYQAGTSSKITIYQNSQATTPHANPVTADSAGMFSAIFLAEVANYKFILKTAMGVTVQTVDRIPPGNIDIETLAQAVEDAQQAAEDAAAAASSVQPEMDSRAYAITSYHPTTAPNKLRTAGYATTGDLGGALYKKVVSEPGHAGKFSIILADGVTVVWYEIADVRLNIRQFGAVGNGTADDTAAVQAAVTFAAGRPLYAPAGTYRITTSINCCDATQMFVFRPGVKIIGDGIGKTKFLNNAAGACFLHMITEAQGASNYFTRGVELAHFEIIADGNTPANSSGLKIQGSYHPWFHDMNVNGMTKDGIEFTEETPGWAGTPNPDRYAIADATIDRCNLSGNGRDGIRIENAACQAKVRGSYIVGNSEAGIFGHSSAHEISGSSISGNGTLGMANSGGLVFIRHPVWGTPQNIHVHHNEIDANWNRQIFADTFMSVFEYNRHNDDPTWGSGAFLAPVQIELSPSNGSDCRGNVVRANSFRFTSVGSQNVTAVRMNLSVADGSRQLKYNTVEDSRFSIAGATSGAVTEYAEVNGSSPHAIGNRWATIEYPIGTSKSVVGSKNMADASASQTIVFPFKPTSVRAVAWVIGTNHKSEGDISIDGIDSGLYYYPTNSGWYTHVVLISIRTGSGDIYDGTARVVPGALIIDWTKSGAPTGVIEFKITAEP